MPDSALIIVSAKHVSRKDAKTAKKTGGWALRPLREMAQTTIKALASFFHHRANRQMLPGVCFVWNAKVADRVSK